MLWDGDVVKNYDCLGIMSVCWLVQVHFYFVAIIGLEFYHA